MIPNFRLFLSFSAAGLFIYLAICFSLSVFSPSCVHTVVCVSNNHQCKVLSTVNNYPNLLKSSNLSFSSRCHRISARERASLALLDGERSEEVVAAALAQKTKFSLGTGQFAVINNP